MLATIRGNAGHYAGHNPAGSWSIYLLLGLALASCISGILDYQGWGGDRLADFHDAASTVMLGLVGVHLAGVAVASILHRENLAVAMVTGMKRGTPTDAIARGEGRYGAAVLIGCVVVAVLLA